MNLLAAPLTMNDKTRNLDWSDGDNVEFFGQGGIAKMKGNKLYIDVAGTLNDPNIKILGVSEYIKEDRKYLVFVYSDDTEAHLCFCDGVTTTYTVVKSGLDKDGKYHFCGYNNGIAVSNGKQNPFIFFYDEKPSIVTCRIKESWGVYADGLCLFRGRLFAFGDSNGILYYSALGDPSEWSREKDGGYFSEIYGSDLPIEALFNYGDSLAIHRKKQTILLTGSTTTDFAFKPLCDRGSVSKRGVINYDNKQLFYDEGIFAIQYGSLQQIQLSNELSRIISPAFVNMHPDNFKNIVATYLPRSRQVWFFMASSDELSSELDIVWIMDRKNPKGIGWYKRKATPVLCACLFKEDIYTGTSDGKILIENFTNQLNGEDFNAGWYSTWLKFNTAKLKSVETGLDILFDGSVSNQVTMELRYNTDTTKVKRKNVTPTQANKGVWGVSKFGSAVFRKLKSVPKRVNIPSSFKSLQVGFTSTKDFVINGLSFYDVVIEE